MGDVQIPELVFVKGGNFKMGCLEKRDGQPQEEWEQTIYEPTIDDFWIGKYLVTNKEFVAFLNDYGSDRVKKGIMAMDKVGGFHFPFKGKKMVHKSRWGIRKSRKGWYVREGYEKYPASRVTWFGANEYCHWLQDYMKDYQDDWGGTFHLPLESQWEYAARGGNKSRDFKFSGSNNIDEVAWFYQNAEKELTHEVGLKKANELGIHDMSGNTFEWCNDWFKKPIFRSIRGGDSTLDDIDCRICSRLGQPPKYKAGFRIAKSKIDWNSIPYNMDKYTL